MGAAGAQLPLLGPKRGKGDGFCSELTGWLFTLLHAIWSGAFSVS